jgi:hypothetical protein
VSASEEDDDGVDDVDDGVDEGTNEAADEDSGAERLPVVDDARLEVPDGVAVVETKGDERAE